MCKQFTTHGLEECYHIFADLRIAQARTAGYKQKMHLLHQFCRQIFNNILVCPVSFAQQSLGSVSFNSVAGTFGGNKAGEQLPAGR